MNPSKNTKAVSWLVLFIIAMFAFGYALVPLYNVFCEVTGLNGKGNFAGKATMTGIDESRTITVQFDASLNATLPWKFYPITKKIMLHPGESKQIAYFAENDTNHDMTVQAIPSVSPGDAAQYLKKTECFCFTQQTLKAHEKVNMPVIFNIDPALPKHIKTITLSYTLFDTAGVRVKDRKDKGKL